ncbi:MAG: TRAP transporter TatT component family protein [Treponema sp.]|nr:TRAP transporter TatT component family protein [Treponema sp.]
MKIRFIIVLTVFSLLFSACSSIQKLAMNMVANVLTGDGGSDVFTGDSDPELVGDAIPFAIKLYETLLAGNQEHQGLINTTGSLFVMYANAFIQGPAEMLPRVQYEERQAAIARAKNMYLRGLSILYRGLDLKYPGFSASYRDGKLSGILAKTTKEDVSALYWSAAAGVSAFSLNPFDLSIGVRLPEFYALIERAYELDPDFNGGVLDEFLLMFHASVPESMGGDKSRVETHFARALEKSGGKSAGTYVAYANSVCVPAQNYDKFKEMLEKALAIDIDDVPSNRLVNIINQRKARYLLASAPQYFIFVKFDDDDGWDDDDWNDEDW